MENLQTKINSPALDDSRRWLWLSVLTLVGIALVFFGSAAHSAPESGKPGEMKQKVIRFDALQISGEAAKPQVYYLLNRKQILFRHEPVKKDLVEQIRQTVEGEPF